MSARAITAAYYIQAVPKMLQKYTPNAGMSSAAPRMHVQACLGVLVRFLIACTPCQACPLLRTSLAANASLQSAHVHFLTQNIFFN